MFMDMVEKCEELRKELHELKAAKASPSGPITGETPCKPPPSPAKTTAGPAGLSSSACNVAQEEDDKKFLNLKAPPEDVAERISQRND